MTETIWRKSDDGKSMVKDILSAEVHDINKLKDERRNLERTLEIDDSVLILIYNYANRFHGHNLATLKAHMQERVDKINAILAEEAPIGP